jgi:hypothetical protein
MNIVGINKTVPRIDAKQYIFQDKKGAGMLEGKI